MSHHPRGWGVSEGEPGRHTTPAGWGSVRASRGVTPPPRAGCQKSSSTSQKFNFGSQGEEERRGGEEKDERRGRTPEKNKNHHINFGEITKIANFLTRLVRKNNSCVSILQYQAISRYA